MFICIVGVSLGTINLLGYIKCQKNHKVALKSFLMKKAVDSISPDQMAKWTKIASDQVIKNITPD